MHQRVASTVDNVLGPVTFNQATMTNSQRESLSVRIRANGQPSFSTAGLTSDQAKKKTMDTYMIVRTELVTKTVREFSQNDRVAIATYIILTWYRKGTVSR